MYAFSYVCVIVVRNAHAYNQHIFCVTTHNHVCFLYVSSLRVARYATHMRSFHIMCNNRNVIITWLLFHTLTHIVCAIVTYNFSYVCEFLHRIVARVLCVTRVVRCAYNISRANKHCDNIPITLILHIHCMYITSHIHRHNIPRNDNIEVTSCITVVCCMQPYGTYIHSDVCTTHMCVTYNQLDVCNIQHNSWHWPPGGSGIRNFFREQRQESIF